MKQRPIPANALPARTEPGFSAAQADSRLRMVRCRSLAATACAVIVLGLASTAWAQAPAPLPPEKLNWDGDPAAPDLSGVWVRANPAPAPGAAPVSKEGWLPWPPPLKPDYATVWQKRVADAAAGKRMDDQVRRCLPPGMPRFITGTNGPLLIIQTPGRVTMYRDGDPVRRIWLNGRTQPKPADVENFSNGNAIGHYEGDNLVTDVVGLREYPIDGTGVPHSDDMRIAERYHRVDAKTLVVQVELTDATAYTAPLRTTVTYTALADAMWTPKEFICTPGTDYSPETYVQ